MNTEEQKHHHHQQQQDYWQRYLALPHYFTDRWELCQPILKTNFQSPKDLIQQLKKIAPRADYKGLASFISLEDGRFMNEILPFIQALILEAPQLFPDEQESHIPLLRARVAREVTLSKRQVACIIAMGLFYLLPFAERGDFNSSNFGMLFTKFFGHTTNKLQCVLHYFQRIMEDQPEENITFARHVVENVEELFLENLVGDETLLCDFQVLDGGIEDSESALQMDFANEYIGGGVLGGGCVQEEIRFSVSTECLLSMALCQRMRQNESIVIIGAERFSSYTGYGMRFRYDGDFKEDLDIDDVGRKKVAIVAIDALVAIYAPQYSVENMNREVIKAYAGFSIPQDILQAEYPCVATGNWGCGAFGGALELKVLLQWIAASKAGKPVSYHSYGSPKAAQLPELVEALLAANVTVGQVADFLLSTYSSEEYQDYVGRPVPGLWDSFLEKLNQA